MTSMVPISEVETATFDYEQALQKVDTIRSQWKTFFARSIMVFMFLS